MFNAILGFLRDPVVGVIIGLASLFLSLRPKIKGRSLRWAMVSDTRLLDMEELQSRLAEIDDALKPVLFGDARIVTLQVWNDGNTSIPPEAIYRPITVEFIGAQIMSVTPVKENPGDPAVMVVRHKSNPGKITIKKTLLNPGTKISLVIALQKSERAPTALVEATIDGVKQIKSGLPDRRNLVVQSGIAGGCLLIACLVIANDPRAAIAVNQIRIFNLFYVMVNPFIITALNTTDRLKIKYDPPRLAVHNRYLAGVWLTFTSLAILYWVTVPA